MHPEGRPFDGGVGFQATLDAEGRIILESYAEIPAREKWLFENPTALSAVREGLEQSAAWQTFWYYGPDKKQITILAITPHP